MDSDQGKLFIGGISWETSEEKLKDHFELYGEVLQTVVMKDKATGRPRGFGFVVFADPSTLDRVLKDTHTIDGRTVDAKKAMSREEQQTSSRPGNGNVGRSFGGGGNYKTKKIFVGGLPPTLSEEGFRQYFEAYGAVNDVVIMYDQQTQRPRGFGFIVFENEESVDRVVAKNFHDLQGKMVEVKRAMPKDANPGGGGGGGVRTMGGAGGGYGGNLGGSYDGRKSQDNGGGCYQSYGSGYNAPASYGYGGGENYGVYGGYGGSNPGYGGQAGAGYGNPNATGAGYGSGQQGSWNGQAASGYGNVGSWGGQNANSGGGNSAAAAAMMGQSAGAAAAGYGNQGYGYGGGYGAGNDGSYGNQVTAGYGAVGGRPVQSGNGSEMHGSYGYGDLNGNSSGYGGNQGWRNDPSQNSGNYGADNGYGGGYGGAPAQQVQQQ